jgi:ATP-dependent 26S proteasome regulatory subunit
MTEELRQTFAGAFADAVIPGDAVVNESPAVLLRTLIQEVARLSRKVEDMDRRHHRSIVYSNEVGGIASPRCVAAKLRGGSE